MHRSSTVYKQKESKTVINKFVCGFWYERTTGYGLLLEEVLLRIILARNSGLKLKRLDEFVSYKHAAFLSHKTLSDGLEWCGLLVDYCDVFISCLGSHSDGTHSMSKCCKEISSNPFWWRNKLIYILNGLKGSQFSANFHFGLNYSFNVNN